MKLNLALLAGILTLPVLSSAAVITFEGYADLTSFTTQDFGNGVTFAGATVLTLGGSLNPVFPPHSGVNVIYNNVGPMSLAFTSPVDFFSGFFTYNQTVLIQAFNSANTLVGSAVSACSVNRVGSGSECAANEFMQVIAIGQISSVSIAGGGGNNFTVDDISSTGSQDAGVSQVPEPGTIALLLGGLSVAAFSRRKRTN